MKIESGHLEEAELIRRVCVSISPKIKNITEEMVAKVLRKIGTNSAVRTDANVQKITKLVQKRTTNRS